MQRILLLALLLALSVTGCEKDRIETTAAPTEPLTRSALNALVEDHLQTTDRVFDWNDASDQVVWSALTLSDREAVLGYQPADFENLPDRIHEIEVTAGEWKTTRDRLVADLRAATERLTGEAPTDEELFVAPEDGVLPILEVRILHPGVLAEFRRRPEVRYLEPSNYSPEEIEFRSDSGCSGAPAANLDGEDYYTVAPGAKVSWTYEPMGIPQAWTRSQGDNIGICIIDSGTYPEQDRLNGNFGNGRELTRLGVYQPSWWSSRTDGPDDQCGHGTQMAGLAAAPLTGTGSSVGVAYKSDLLAIRATSDVIINASKEKRGVKDALVIAGQDAGTQIVSMSIGDVFSSGTVKDGVYYAHNRGKMILAAAGTSLSWTSWYGVIFPASMNETVAVTGIQTGTPYLRCNTCHDGSEVDFVAVMQRREDNGRSTITLSRNGATPGYVGGSSAATATTAGIAALVWATNPGQTREQVLQRMKAASSLYPGRSGDFGWGIVNADLATR
ncbi:subtilisin family serine protease [Neolewinella xylanilytica]|uniref:Subtilisin family serine protease n=1 Tax=Neolewinella xylanilytica TaxID=1514080 RepID=A0A2S6IAJ9_9BACT|nr:S8 family serine peptidase [Neolewinella xylanilytica]PPK88518.1 subtilisin family serine protease [Neolewinella xylanilytica]